MFDEDATFLVGHFPKAKGFEQIAAGAQAVYNMCTELKHETTLLHSVRENLFITEGTVTYTASGQVLAPIPLVSVFELVEESDKIKDYRAYLDINALLIAAANPVR